MNAATSPRAMRRARVPVLAIGRDPLRVPPRVAVVGVDFSASCLEAARAALDLLADGGTLHLVHVWARFPIEYPELEKRDAAYERSLPGRFAQLEAALLDRARDVTILSSSLLGEPAEQITAFAQSHNADIVAAGRQGHRLFERLLLGRVTTGLVRGAPCTVLVTPEPSGLEREALQRTLTGTSESRAPEEWAALLTAFTQRNRSRRTTLEVDDPAFGAQSQESGYTLLGAVYDHQDRRVELMLGLPGAAGTHVTRMIPDVTSLAVHAASDGRDAALRVEHGTGQTLLTFLPGRG
jgi:nucleotide-binding universal stress UspA family protein